MGLWRDLLSWGNGPAPATERTSAAQSPRFSRSINFTLDIPPEMATGGATVPTAYQPPVSRREAMSVPAVKRARDLICGTLGSLPLQVHNSNREVIPWPLIDQPEEPFARSVTMANTVEDLLFEGRSWWRVTQYGWHGYPTKARRLEPRSVVIRKEGRVYTNDQTGNPQGLVWDYVPDSELIRIESPTDGILHACAGAIRACILLAQTTARYAKEPLPLGYFSPAEGMGDPGNPDEIQQTLDEWETARQTNAWGYVGAALRANVLQWNPEQLQLAQARDYAALEIARLTGLDPEDLGINTTSRTYQNAEMRRLDLIDFTLRPYVSAIEDRLSMGDVMPRGDVVRAQYEHYLRSDTLTRMQVYQLGRQVGVYNDARIAELENIPSATPQAPPQPPPPPVPPNAGEGGGSQDTGQHSSEAPVTASVSPHAGERFHFADTDASITVGFALDPAAAQFAVDSAKRTVSGVALPWNQVAYSGGKNWSFEPGSLHWGSAASRIKLNKDHDRDQTFGAARAITSTDTGLSTSFRVARGELGDSMIAMAEDGVYDGFSVEVEFDGPNDSYTPHPADPSVNVVHSATLRAVALTAMPAFDDARVVHVAATREVKEPAMTAPAAPAAPPAQAPVTPTPGDPAVTAAAAPAPDFAAFTAGLTQSIGSAVAEAFAALPQPQGRQVVPVGQGASVVREPLVYAMDGHGPSMVRDAWKARTEGDHDARERLSKFSLQLAQASREVAQNPAGAQFAANTSNTSAVIPPGYRPDMYVTQLMQGRPLWNGCSRGTLTDATPFTLPSFTSASGMTGAGTEGTNPSAGTITIASKTVTPGSVTGLFTLTREIVDSSNPAIDAIAVQAMQESYSQQTEAKIYAELNGANGVGGTITSGFVPSGAQVSTTTGGSAGAGTLGGEKLIPGIRAALALYPFRRFNAPNRMFLSSEATSALATAVDGNGRPLLPSVGAQNSAGVGNAVTQGWYVDGLPAQPAWGMTGNASGDADVIGFNSVDVWVWESPLLTFRFEERSGPANIDLALFAYTAVRVLRPVGLIGIRHTVGA